MIWLASQKNGGESHRNCVSIHIERAVKLTVSRPTTKEVIKKEWKDLQTHARFGLFRAGKKLSRKAEL